MNTNEIATTMTFDLTPADLAANLDDTDLADALLDDAPESDYYESTTIDAIEAADHDTLRELLITAIRAMR